MGEERQASNEEAENVEAETVPIVGYQPHGMKGTRQASDEEWGERGSAHQIRSTSGSEWGKACFGRRDGHVEAEIHPS